MGTTDGATTGNRLVVRAWSTAGSSVGDGVVPIRQGCGFDPWSGHVQEAPSDCLRKEAHTPMSLSEINPSMQKLNTELPCDSTSVCGSEGTQSQGWNIRGRPCPQQQPSHRKARRPESARR